MNSKRIFCNVVRTITYYSPHLRLSWHWMRLKSLRLRPLTRYKRSKKLTNAENKPGFAAGIKKNFHNKLNQASHRPLATGDQYLSSIEESSLNSVLGAYRWLNWYRCRLYECVQLVSDRFSVTSAKYEFRYYTFRPVVQSYQTNCRLHFRRLLSRFSHTVFD